MGAIQLLGAKDIRATRQVFYKCKQCGGHQLCLRMPMPRCYTCGVEQSEDSFGTVFEDCMEADCAFCGGQVRLLERSLAYGRFHICSNCNNIVAVKHQGEFLSPTKVLSPPWIPDLIDRSEQLGPCRVAICETAVEHLVVHLLFMIASNENPGFKYGDDAEHKSLIVFDSESYVGYIMWTSDLPRGIATLRQLFVRSEFRRRGIASAIVKYWTRRIAFQSSSQFEVETPNRKTIGLLVKLGYAKQSEVGVAGVCCTFVGGIDPTPDY
ncbi:MAG: GNAT family N-acetyltransferase [Paludibaculum sp.]